MTQRFKFGQNWQRFLTYLTDERIAEAEKSLRAMLGAENLAGRSFLDIGSGSGLFSLAARRLGARVRSFDYDRDSVACSEDLKQRFEKDPAAWTVSWGDVLDADFMAGLGTATMWCMRGACFITRVICTARWIMPGAA
jgi:2-polyprenyl-3-methyl-5-hydroxy-6-metoxy-1,4-benzoquinol methylase